MKKNILTAMFLLIGTIAKSQNQGANLHLVFNVSEPRITKNVYKYVRNDISNPAIYECGVFKIGSNGYCYNYPFFYGMSLELLQKRNAVAQIIPISQVASLYPTARTAAQLDADMQPAINYDYANPIDEYTMPYADTHTVKYFQSFDKVFVIEYLPSGNAKVIECVITSKF